jgi:hypothetical protein
LSLNTSLQNGWTNGWTTQIKNKVTEQDLIIPILECCCEFLCKDLIQSTGGFFTPNSEDQILATIKCLAVERENTMFLRFRLGDMQQCRDKTIGAFSARFRGQAVICILDIKYPGGDNQANCRDTILPNVPALRMADQAMQPDLFGELNKNMSLQEIVRFIKTKRG